MLLVEMGGGSGGKSVLGSHTVDRYPRSRPTEYSRMGMNPSAIAIQFDAIISPIAGARGLTPVVVITDQDSLGIKRAPAPQQRVPLAVGAGRSEPDLSDASLSGEHREGFRPETMRGREIWVVDVSSSMSVGIRSMDQKSRLEHVQEKIAGMIPAPRSPHQSKSLVVFDKTAKEVWTSESDTPRTFRQAIAGMRIGRGSSFEAALAETRAIIRRNALDPENPERTGVVFMTDGEDSRESKLRTAALARELRDANTGILFVGVGDGYNQRRMIELSSQVGFSGWSHTPLTAGNPVFGIMIPGFLQELFSCGHYLRVIARGSVEKYFGMMPSFRHVDDCDMRVGYQRESMGIILASRDDLKLRLRIGRHALDLDTTNRDIDILDASDARIPYEVLKRGEAAIGALLTMLAQLGGDVRGLDALKAQYPDRSDAIDELMRLLCGDQNDENVRLGGRAAASELGSAESIASYDQRSREAVNDWSNVGGGSESLRSGVDYATGRPLAAPTVNGSFDEIFGSASAGGGRGGVPTEPELHSGNLGPLDDAPPSNIPSMHGVDANAYDRVVPVAHTVITHWSGNAILSSYSLEALPEGGTFLIGRINTTRVCDLVLKGDLVSRKHAKITCVGDNYILEDLKSKNGTFVDGLRVLGPTVLKPGSKITFGGSLDQHLTFNRRA